MSNKSKTTVVTGLWDIGRQNLSEGWSRPFSHYIDNFSKLLQNIDNNMIIFGEENLREVIYSYRKPENTQFVVRQLDWFKTNSSFYDDIQKIRNNPNWYNQAGWLPDSTQAKLEMYNPIVMSKMFLLNDAAIMDPFDSDLMFWIDAGLTNTVHPGYFSKDRVIDKITNFVNKFLFVCFPYETNSEIHGFDINGMNKYSNTTKVNRVARGGFFGGQKEVISKANQLYYELLTSSLKEGLMGTEESIFTIMTYLDPQVYEYESIEDNGLLSTFFENVKDNKIKIQKINAYDPSYGTDRVSIYINAFNSVDQLQLLFDSFEKYDKRFLSSADLILINNTVDEKLLESYKEIVKKYDLREIKEGNKGICGARQWAANDFVNSKNKYMLFFEDDMLLDLEHGKTCPFGFNKFVPNLFDNMIRIMEQENYDFLKLSFSEFYGHNGEQWSWHNVPGDKKIEYFGNRSSKPHTKFNHIKSLRSVIYADGEVYYSNWPHIISQRGNHRCFLDTQWAYPYEQTWMSHMYTLTLENKIKPATLLHSPITHNRVFHYHKDERKEN